MGRLPPFAGAILTAMAFYWLSYVATQILANFVLAMEGIELRFIAPLPAEFGVIAAVFVSTKTAGEIVGAESEATLRGASRRVC